MTCSGASKNTSTCCPKNRCCLSCLGPACCVFSVCVCVCAVVLLLLCCGVHSKHPPCVHSTRPRVSVQNVPVYAGTTRTRYNRTHMLDLRDSIFGSSRQMTINPKKSAWKKKRKEKRMANKEFSTSFFFCPNRCGKYRGCKTSKNADGAPNGKTGASTICCWKQTANDTTLPPTVPPSAPEEPGACENDGMKMRSWALRSPPRGCANRGAGHPAALKHRGSARRSTPGSCPPRLLRRRVRDRPWPHSAGFFLAEAEELRLGTEMSLLAPPLCPRRAPYEWCCAVARTICSASCSCRQCMRNRRSRRRFANPLPWSPCTDM